MIMIEYTRKKMIEFSFIFYPEKIKFYIFYCRINHYSVKYVISYDKLLLLLISTNVLFYVIDGSVIYFCLYVLYVKI